MFESKRHKEPEDIWNIFDILQQDLFQSEATCGHAKYGDYSFESMVLAVGYDIRLRKVWLS